MSCGCSSPASTLFKLIAGLEKPDQGSLTVAENVKIMYVDQNRMGLQDGRYGDHEPPSSLP